MTTGTARWMGAAILIVAIGAALFFWDGFDVVGLKAGIEGLGIGLQSVSIVSWIEPDEVAALRKGGGHLAVVDVRERDEVAGVFGHIPFGSIVADPNQIAHFKDRLVVLVCRTDRRSATAALALADVQLPNVSVLRGGMERWKALGLPVERESGAATVHANVIHSE